VTVIPLNVKDTRRREEERTTAAPASAPGKEITAEQRSGNRAPQFPEIGRSQPTHGTRQRLRERFPQPACRPEGTGPHEGEACVISEYTEQQKAVIHRAQVKVPVQALMRQAFE
jgi:hypothetical protein